MENSNPKLSGKARGCLWHLGSYVIVIGMLAMINLVAGDNEPWFLYPALGWGAAVAIHLVWTTLAGMKNIISGKWRGFLGHLGTYVAVITMLAMINMITGGNEPWFLYPAAAWGAGLAFHLLGAILGTESRREERKERKKRKKRRREQEETGAETEAEAAQARPAEKVQARPPEEPPLKKGATNPTIQAHLHKALAYQAQINNLIKITREPTARARLQDLAGQVGEWVEAIKDLAKRLDDFQQNSLIRQDFESVPQAIAGLEARLAGENDPALRSQLERTLANRRKQMNALERLQNTMQRAEIQIESTLSSLGTIYSQLLTGQSTDHVADYSRLSAEVEEEVHTLQDHLEALEEVKLGRF